MTILSTILTWILSTIPLPLIGAIPGGLIVLILWRILGPRTAIVVAVLFSGAVYAYAWGWRENEEKWRDRQDALRTSLAAVREQRNAARKKIGELEAQFEERLDELSSSLSPDSCSADDSDVMRLLDHWRN